MPIPTDMPPDIADKFDVFRQSSLIIESGLPEDPDHTHSPRHQPHTWAPYNLRLQEGQKALPDK